MRAGRMPGGWTISTIAAVLFAACVAAMAPGVAGASERTGDATAARAAQQVLVQFAPEVAVHRRSGALAAAGVLDARPAGPTGFAVATVPPGRTRAEILAALRVQPGVVSAQPDTLMTASDTPADPLFPSQWALSNTGQSPHGIAGVAGDDVNAVDAWQQVSPASLGSITVAVVDTGVRAEHPDLAASIVGGYDALGASYDAEDDASARADGNGHGTHVAGIIAATADDGGIVGLARGVKIMPVRALDANGQGTASSVAMGFEWAAEHGAQIVNASLGGDVPAALSEVVRRHPSVLFVVSAGNDGRADGASLCTIPFSNVLCVTATDERDQKPRWANFGAPNVDLAAPGVDIVSDYLHTTSTPLDLEHAAAWDLGPGWTVGGGVLRFHSTGQVPNDGSGADTPNAVLRTPFPVPAGQVCHLDYDVASTIPSDDHAGGRIELPDGYVGMSWEDTWLGGVRDDVSMPAQGYASWSVRPRFIVNRAVYTVPVAHGDDDITVRRLRLTCSDARVPADSGDVDELSGTSMAAPMVAATAALVLAATPSARPEDLVGKIECGVDPVSGLGGFQTLSGGRLDARGALAARLGSRPTAPVGHLSTVLAGSQPVAFALAPDGSIVFSDRDGVTDGYTGWLLKRLRPDGGVQTIAGPGTPYDSSDGPAAGHWIGHPTELAVSPDGSIWFPGYDGGIRRIDPEGVLHTVAGDQSLLDVHALHAEADGTLLFAHRGSDGRLDNEVVSRVTRAGALTLLAGDGTVAEPGAVAPTARRFAQINAVTRDAGGALMIGERTEYAWVPLDQMWSAINRLDGGVLKPWLQTRIGVGEGPEGATVDKAWIDLSSFVLVGGAAVIRPQDGTRLWSLAPGGTLARIGGTGGSASSLTPMADGSLATDVQFGEVRGIAAAPDGTLFLDDIVAQQLRKIDTGAVAVAQPFAPCVEETAEPEPEPQAPGGQAGGGTPSTTAPPTAAAPGPAAIPGAGVLGEASAPSPAAKAKAKRAIVLNARASVFTAHSRLRVVFTVTGTRGVKLRLRCTGTSCPRSLPRATIGRRAIKLVVTGLRPGTTLELRGTRAGARGRYVRLRLTTLRRFTRATGDL